KIGRVRFRRYYYEQHRWLRARSVAADRPKHSVSARLLHSMGWPIPIHERGLAAAESRHPIHTADHFCVALHKHALSHENLHRVAGRSVFARRRVLAPLAAGL